MKPNFALYLSHDGIILLHRAPSGRWTEVGDVPLDDPDLRKSMSYLRSSAVALEGKGFATKLVLPNSQILYREIEAPGPSLAEREAQIRAALDGATPYELDDLTFDWSPRAGFVMVAVVANETLDEAETFAVEHRFNPVSFVGRENAEPDAWEPFFGRTDFSHAFLGPDADVRDTPAPGVAPEVDVNLFAASTPGTGADIAAQGPNEASENIFAADDVQGLDQAAAGQPQQDINIPESPPIPAFTSRRQGDSPPPDDPRGESATRPLARVAPRIAISPELVHPVPPDEAPQPEKNATPAPAAANAEAPEITLSSSGLRAAILGQEAAGVARKTGLPDFRGLAQKSGLRIHKVRAIGLGTIKSLAGTVARATSAGARALGRRKSAAPRPPRTEPPLTPPKPTGGEGVAEGQDGDPGAAGKRLKPGPRAASVALLLALLIGGYYLWMQHGPANGPQPGLRTQNGTAESTLAATGGRAAHRPPTRPGDLAQKSAKATAPKRPIRPARRSVFEGRSDPLAKLPETATPVTTLSEQELADIRAAGLNTPTPEELAEASTPSQGGQPSDADIAAAYKASGALQFLRTPPAPAANPEREDIYVASVDRPLGANDAVILPDFNGGVGDQPPVRVLSPLDPKIAVSLDSNGLVKPSPQGTLNPDGILVRSGKPPVIPPQKPQIAQLVPPNPLAALKPKPRPATLKTGADAVFIQGNLTLTQLRKFRARPRPPSIQQIANAKGASPSELAVLTSFKPSRRPSDFAKIVNKARVQLALATATAAKRKPTTPRFANVGPKLPTKASVARRATIRNAINLSRLNLIGVYGTPSRRSALLRLPSGRFVKVKNGDRVDGGKVAAIGTSSLSFVKGGRNRVLKIPN